MDNRIPQSNSLSSFIKESTFIAKFGYFWASFVVAQRNTKVANIGNFGLPEVANIVNFGRPEVANIVNFGRPDIGNFGLPKLATLGGLKFQYWQLWVA